MDPTPQRITGLEARIAKYELELDDASSAAEKSELRGLIKTSRETLNNLLINERKALPQEANPSISGVLDAKFNVFGHGIGLAQLAVGVIGLSTVIAGGGLYAVKHHQRATSKFFNSLLDISENKLSNIPSILPRGPMTVGVDKQPIHKLHLHGAYKSVALVGANRSGKTVFLSNAILNDMFPWWYRYCFPPRGLFLTGSRKAASIDAWLKNQIASTEKDDPWAAVADLLSERRHEQRVRLFLFRMFRFSLPAFLLPQPAIIVIDQAEELLRGYRADFLVGLYNLVKEGRDDKLFRIVLVINSDNAVKALELMNGGNMFDVIEAPKVSREAIVNKFGEEFAKVFDDCDGCIGVALDFLADRKKPAGMSAKEYAALKREQYTSANCLTVEISKEEYNKAGEHFRK